MNISLTSFPYHLNGGTRSKKFGPTSVWTKGKDITNSCLDFRNVEMRIVNYPRLGFQVEGGITHTNQIYNTLEMVYQRTINDIIASKTPWIECWTRKSRTWSM